MTSLLLTLGIPIISSILSAYLAVQLALRRFYKEKWWERKLSAYMSAFEALHLFRFVYAEWQDIFLEERDINTEDKQELLRKRRVAESDIRKAIDIGELLITKEAVDILDAFWLDMHRTLGRRDPVGDYGDCCELADAAIAQLRTIARSDLRLTSRLQSPA